jgi:hypothetical protein
LKTCKRFEFKRFENGFEKKKKKKEKNNKTKSSPNPAAQLRYRPTPAHQRRLPSLSL